MHDQLLLDLIEAKVMLICVIGKDCERWHDVIDELMIGDGTVLRDFQMMTTWHPDEGLEEVIDFAKRFDIVCPGAEEVQVIEV